MRLTLSALCLALTPLAVPAQTGPAFDPGALTNCLADGHGAACIGRGAEACTMTTPGGGSNIGYGACIEAERSWWDIELNTAYQMRMNEARSIDREAPIPGLRPRPSDVESLRAMQRAWIAFRDATCAFEELQWWGGTGAGAAGNACRMRMTGEQTLYLRSLLGG